jgi:hypothetical protein
MRVVIFCLASGSDRLMPLTFGTMMIEERPDLDRRPVAKCTTCGERTYVTAEVHRALSRD